jgi:hypothetical protein
MNTLKLGRLVFGVMYLVGGLIHLLLGVFNAAAFNGLGESALIPFYRDVFTAVIPLYAVQFALGIGVFELIIGLMILSKGTVVNVGLLLSVLFQMLLAPLGWWGFANITLAVVQVLWLREEYEVSILSEVASRVPATS